MIVEDEDRRKREVSRLAHPLPQSDAWGQRMKSERVQSVPRLVNGFDMKKRIRLICL